MPLLVFLQFTEMDQIMCKSLKNSYSKEKQTWGQEKKIDTKSYPSLLLMNGHKFSSYKRELEKQTVEGTESAELENEKIHKLKGHSHFQYGFLKCVFQYFSAILSSYY